MSNGLNQIYYFMPNGDFFVGKTRSSSNTFILKPMVLCINMALGSTLILASTLAAAQTEAAVSRTYNIAAGSLNQVLTQFSAQSGSAISMNGEQLSTIQSQGLQGSYQIEQGFDTLLSGTNYRVEQTLNGYAILEKSNVNISATNIVEKNSASTIISTGALDVAGVVGGNAGQSDTFSSAFDTYKSTASAHYVSREILEQVPYSRTGDIFNGIPGVAAATNTNSTGLQVNIRGLQGHGRVRTLIDGAQQSVSTYRGYPGNRDDTYIDPDLIGAINVKKGPDADASSAGVIGGVVSMRTLNADDIITDPDKKWGVRLRGSYGNNIMTGEACIQAFNRECLDRSRGVNVGESIWIGEYITDLGGKIPEKNYAGSAALALRPTDNIEITLAHAERESGNYKSGKRGADEWKGIYRDFNDQEVFNTSINSQSSLVKTKISFLDNHSLALSYVNYENNSGYHNSTNAVFSGPKSQAHLKKTIAENYTANYAWQSENPWFDVRANLWKSKVEGGEEMDGLKIFSDIIGGELFNTSQLPVPRGQLNVKYGLSFSKEKSQFGDTESNDGIFINGERDNTGLFTNLNWQATPWLVVNAGLQHNRSEARNLDHRLIRNNLKGVNELDLQRNYSSTTPNFELVAQPYDGLQLFARWSKAKRNPSLRELFMSTLVESDPNLRPEDQRNIEYGLSFVQQGLITEDDHFGIKLSRFDNLTNDYIARVSWYALGENPMKHKHNYVFYNIDKVHLKGYELSMDYNNYRMFANAGLTYFDSLQTCYPDRDRFDNAIASQCYNNPGSDDWSASYMPPRFEANATLGLKFLEGKIKFGGKIRHSTASLSGGYLRGAPVSDMTWDEYTVYDLFGSYKITKNIELGFSVENLTDQYYIPSYSNALEALPAPGRTARGTLTLNF